MLPPKYLNTSFSKGKIVFGLDIAKSHILSKGFVIVVEGQIDCIRLKESNIHNVVATGTSALSYYQLGLLSRYTDNIIILFDNDMAGDKGYEQVLKKFDKLSKFSRLQLPFGYKDVDEYLTDNEPASLNLLSSYNIY